MMTQCHETCTRARVLISKKSILPESLLCLVATNKAKIYQKDYIFRLKETRIITTRRLEDLKRTV